MDLLSRALLFFVSLVQTHEVKESQKRSVRYLDMQQLQLEELFDLTPELIIVATRTARRDAHLQAPRQKGHDNGFKWRGPH